MIVNNPDAIINDAFDWLGEPDKTANVGWGGNGEDPDYTIIWNETLNNGNPDGPDHAVLGDSDGNTIHNPYNPDVEGMEEDYTNDVYIHRSKE